MTLSAPTLGVISVLYGNRTVPTFLSELSLLPDTYVSVVDNSGDCTDSPKTVLLSRPGSNLGYTCLLYTSDAADE